MGAFLDKPITEKETITGRGNGLEWGCSCMQGWRVEMEDAHTCETNVPARPGTSFFAVFDGHGGSFVSKVAARDLLPCVQDTAAYKTGDKSAETLKQALYDGILQLDADIRETEEVKDGEDISGSTAVMSFITPTHFVIANTGDSRAVLVRGGKVEFGTVDHKPSDPGERSRVEDAGGFVEMGRVCGNLAVSRALGDFQYKDNPDMPAQQQKITAAADMTVLTRSQDDECLILCCDGIWDVMTNEQVHEFVSAHLKGGYKVGEICERLMDDCLMKNSKDNMSVLIVLFAGAPKEQAGFVVPPLGPDETDAERIREENAAQNAAGQVMLQRLSTALRNPDILEGAQAAGTGLGGQPPEGDRDGGGGSG